MRRDFMKQAACHLRAGMTRVTAFGSSVQPPLTASFTWQIRRNPGAEVVWWRYQKQKNIKEQHPHVLTMSTETLSASALGFFPVTVSDALGDFGW